jgi:hypothetical protein
MNIKHIALETCSWLLAVIIGLFIFGTTPVGAQDAPNTLDKVPTGNIINCIEVQKGHTVCTLNAASEQLKDFKVNVPSNFFKRHH